MGIYAKINEHIFHRIFQLIPENNRVERIWKLAQVDFKKRYYNDKLGLLWALINPAMQVAIYYFVFTNFFDNREENYALKLFAALILWRAFTESASKGANILKVKRYLIENIQFNWLDLFYSNIISNLLGYLFNLVVFFILAITFGVSFPRAIVLYPIILLNWFFISFAVSIFLSLIRPVFDDIIHIWNIVVMIGFWTSGIFFPGNKIIETLWWSGYVNPFIGIILNTRACLIEGNEFYMKLFIYDLHFGFILFLISIFAFKKYAKKITERI